MRQLSADYFARSPLLIYPLIALGLFFLVFVIISVRAMRTKRAELDRLAALPLFDSEPESHV